MRTLVEQVRKNAETWLNAAGLADDVDPVNLFVFMGGEPTAENDWRLQVHQDAIIVGTQDMLLSRALNRGFGSSRFLWPVEFGVLNTGCHWVFGEGRVSWKGNQARSGLDAVRSVATLQHDRRITAFTRLAIAERFGLSNVAVPVGRIIAPTRVRAEVAVTATVDPWLGSVKAMRLIPTGVGSWLRTVERAMFDLSQASTTGEGDMVLDVLVPSLSSSTRSDARVGSAQLT